MADSGILSHGNAGMPRGHWAVHGRGWQTRPHGRDGVQGAHPPLQRCRCGSPGIVHPPVVPRLGTGEGRGGPGAEARDGADPGLSLAAVAHRRGHPDKVGAALARCGGAVQAVPPEERLTVQTRIGAFSCRGWAAYGEVYSMNLRLVFGGCMWGVAE